jgi:hypothetical protein
LLIESIRCLVGRTKEGHRKQTGISIPVRLEYKDSKITHDSPADGSLNDDSRKKLFPSWFIEKVKCKEYQREIQELDNNVESQLK